MRITIDLGIDLGTTNSTIAVYKNMSPQLLKDVKGDSILPSAVHIKEDGSIITGNDARSLLEIDPGNTAIEFKRLMGTQEKILFSESGQSYTPIDLSSFILKDILLRATPENGFSPTSAVITIPAMFQLPQCEATRKAAQLAGLNFAPLLQEPIAAAIAHASVTEKREGYWMIYDFGGGTFDVSLVRSREGRLQVLDHDGDNHLGGKDLDRVVAQQAVQMIRAEGKLDNFKRSDPRFTQAFVKLKAEAERLRILLSEKEEGLFKVNNLFTTDSGESISFEMNMDREKLENIILSTVLRTTELCKDVLSRNRLKSSNLNGLVMVGGPTLTPNLPNILQKEIGIEAQHYMNPMNIVAYGAAIFASTQKLPREHWSQFSTQGNQPVDIFLEFESMTTNKNPYLIGRVSDDANQDVSSVLVKRSDELFKTEKISLNEQMAFMIPLDLKSNSQNIFNLNLYNSSGQEVPCLPSEITIIHGLSVGSPPLSESVGIMLSDNSVAWYLKKGVALPAENKMTHATTVSLARGQSGEAISVPFLQGNSDRADRNKVIGVLRIFAEHISIDLPEGAEIQVTLSVDEFSHTTAQAYVPLLDQWFDNVVKFDIKKKDVEEVGKALGSQLDRLAALDELANKLSEEDKPDVDERVKDIETLIEEGDRDSVDLAEQMVRKMAQKIDQVEHVNQITIIEDDYEKLIKDSRNVLELEGNNDEKKLLSLLDREFNDAMGKGDSKLASQKQKEVHDLFFKVYMRTEEFWLAWFGHLSTVVKESGTGGSQAQNLIERGNRIVNSGQFGKLPGICQELMGFLPEGEKQEIFSNLR